MKKETAMKLPIGPRKGSIVGNVTSKRNIVSFCNVLTVISLFLIPMLAFAENSDGENAKTATPKKTVETCWDTLNTSEAPEKNWGTYYDPKGVFCGDYDCYRILGFCYDEWGRKPPTTRELTQSYRRIGRVWHPDKNKMEGAEDRFAKINKAYQVLTDITLRKEYDYMRERPDEYYHKYGSTVLFHYAPKSDTLAVIVILLVLASVASWFMQKARWQQIADRVIRAAVEGSGPREGGSAQSIEVREKAETIMKERKEKESKSTAAKSSTTTGKEKKTKGAKLTKKEMKEMANEELRPIIVELVNEMKDFGAGFHQPTWKDILIIKMAKWPYFLFTAIVWQVKYMYRRFRKLELNEEERQVLTQRAVGHIAWEAASDEDREEMVKMDLWVTENLEEWRELQEVRQLSAGDQKRYNRWKKKQGSKIE